MFFIFNKIGPRPKRSCEEEIPKRAEQPRGNPRHNVNA